MRAKGINSHPPAPKRDCLAVSHPFDDVHLSKDQQEIRRLGEETTRRVRRGTVAFRITRIAEGGRAGLRPAEWESRTLTHKPL